MQSAPENYHIFPNMQPAIIEKKFLKGYRNLGQINANPKIQVNAKRHSFALRY